MSGIGRGTPLEQYGSITSRHFLALWGWQAPALSAICAFSFYFGAHSSLCAAETRFTPTLVINEEFASNIDLDPDGQEDSAFTTRIIPGFELRRISPRVTAALNVGVEGRHQSAGDDDGFNADVGLAGTGKFELIREHVFLEAGASISQQVLDSSAASTSSNEETVQTYRLSPVFRTRLGHYATGELRGQFEQVFVAKETSDQTTVGGSFDLSTAKKFHRFRGSLKGGYSEAIRPDADDVTRGLVEISGEYAFSRAVHLLAGVGYQHFDDNGSTRFDSPTWRIGTRLRPGRRSEFEADYGLRDDEMSFSARMKYEIGPKTQLTASYRETLSTSQERLVDTLSFAGVDGETDQIVDERDEVPFNPKTDRFDIDDETERIRAFTAALRGNWGRNTVGISGTYAVEEKEDSGEEQTDLRLDFGWSRKLSRRMTLRTALGYEFTEFDTGQEDDEYLASAGLEYQLKKDIIAAISCFFRQQNSTSPTSEFTDHRVMIGLSTKF